MHSLDTQDGRSRRIRGRNTLLGGCGATMMVFLLAGFAYLAWANTWPAPEPDQRALPRPNGYDACAAALALLPPPPNTENPWNSDLPLRRSEVARRRGGLRSLRTAIHLPYLSPASAPSHERQFLRYGHAARQLASEAQLELADGRAGVAMQYALDVIEFGAKLGRGGPVVNSTLGASCAALGRETAEQGLSRLSGAEARAARRRLEAILSQFPEPAEVMEAERRVSLDQLRQVFAGGIPANVCMFNSSIPIPWTEQFLWRARLLAYHKPWGYARVDQYSRAVAAELRKPYPKRALPYPDWLFDDPFLVGASPDLETIQTPLALTPAGLRLLHAQLALREFRLLHGVYPATWGELAADVNRELLIDPFSDRPFRYRRRGATYVLYSVGPNLKDEGGTPVSLYSVALYSTGDLVAGRLAIHRKARAVATPR